MKKKIGISILTIFVLLITTKAVYANNARTVGTATTTQTVQSQNVVKEEATGQLIEMKEKELKSIENYNDKYGSEAYGIKDGEEFIFYLPDILPQELEEPFLEWWPDWNLWKNGSIQTLLSYGIWNVTTGEGFFSSWIEESDIMP